MSGQAKPQQITVTVDASRVKAVLLELDVYVDRLICLLPESLGRLVQLSKLIETVSIDVDVDRSPTVRAGELRVLLKPPDSLLEFMATIKTLDGQ